MVCVWGGGGGGGVGEEARTFHRVQILVKQ